MSTPNQAPGWGKAVGILMIIFGGLGIFIQIYKLVIPQFLKAANSTVFNQLNRMDSNSDPFANSYNTYNAFNEVAGLSDSAANTLMICGFLGLIGCVFYILGGVKLLKAAPANFNFAKYALIGFLILNTLTLILLLASGSSVLVMVILIYVGLGFTIDLVLSIVLLSSDKSAYGIGAPKVGTNTVYTRDEVI